MSHGFDGRYENHSRQDINHGLRETLTRGGYEHSGSFAQFRPVQSAGVDIHLPGVSIDFGTSGQRYGGGYYNNHGGSYYNNGGVHQHQERERLQQHQQQERYNNPYGGSYYNNPNPYGGSYYNNPHGYQHHGGHGGGLQFNFGFGGRHHR